MPQARPMTCGNEYLHIKLNRLKNKLCLNRVHYSFQDKIILSPLPPFFFFCFGVLFDFGFSFKFGIDLAGKFARADGKFEETGK